MKYIITLEEKQIPNVEEWIGAYFGNGEYIEKVVKSYSVDDYDLSEGLFHLCCTGTLRSYLGAKRFFGKNKVHKSSRSQIFIGF